MKFTSLLAKRVHMCLRVNGIVGSRKWYHANDIAISRVILFWPGFKSLKLGWVNKCNHLKPAEPGMSENTGRLIQQIIDTLGSKIVFIKMLKVI